MEASLCSPTQSLLHWHCMACLPPTYSPEPTWGKKGALRQTSFKVFFWNPESSRPNPCPLAVCRSSEGGGTQNKTNVGYCKWQRETTDHIGAASRIKHSPISRFLPKAPHLEFLLMLYPKVKKPELMKEWLCFYISNHQNHPILDLPICSKDIVLLNCFSILSPSRWNASRGWNASGGKVIYSESDDRPWKRFYNDFAK